MAKTGESSAARSKQDAGAAEAALPASYEAAVAELEALVGQMEQGDLTLEASLSAYRRGAALVAFCQQQLDQAEQQVRVLDGETLRALAEPASGAQAARALDTDTDSETGAA
jgi:exodeoxyribonuclease VII small subunit